MIQPVGYFKLWRELFTKPIWINSTNEQKVILITLIAMANYREKKWEWQGKPYECKPGQFITSLNSIAINCGQGVTIKNVRTAIERFEKLEFLTNQSAKTGRLITIENWDVYQGEDDQTGKQSGNQQADSGQRVGNQRATREESKEVEKERINNLSRQISDLRQRYSEKDLEIIDQYFDVLKWTRRNGKIAESVILKIYQKWDEFSVSKVIYALQICIGNSKYHDKKEEYAYGIMRNTTEAEAATKVQPTKKMEDKYEAFIRGE